MDYSAAVERVLADQRYQSNLDWGAARPGHPEGTVRAHIAELERNLERLRPRLADDEVQKLRLLIHTHDTFKADARRGVAINHPSSHASLARAFLAEYCDDSDLLAMVQFHDEPFALWRQVESSGACNRDRFDNLIAAIRNWNLFLAFNIIDSGTVGKDRAPLEWFFRELHGRVETRFTEFDIIDPGTGRCAIR